MDPCSADTEPSGHRCNGLSVALPCPLNGDHLSGWDEGYEHAGIVVVDGQKRGEYRHGVHSLVFFSPDSMRLAYKVFIDPPSESGLGSASVVVDGAMGKKYAEPIGPLIFSPDSQSLAYVANESWWYRRPIDELRSCIDPEAGGPHPFG